MLASAWRLIGSTLEEITNRTDDSKIREELKKGGEFRQQYLNLYDLVHMLVDAGQSQFALLATTAREHTRLC